jgi:hypothetical protein
MDAGPVMEQPRFAKNLWLTDAEAPPWSVRIRGMDAKALKPGDVIAVQTRNRALVYVRLTRIVHTFEGHNPRKGPVYFWAFERIPKPPLTTKSAQEQQP